MTAFLPPNLLALFAPRDPLPFMPMPERGSHCLKHPYTGVGRFLQEFEDPKDTPPPTRVETKDERKERKVRERAEQVAYKLEQDLALWDPHNDTQATTDPFKTLFIARVNFDTSETKLRREFEVYGPIRNIRLISHNENGKPRGYAFIEYEHERDMHSAYKHADGKKIDGRRVLVDVERARTVKGWRPRRLGGGLGSTRKGGADVNSRFSGRDEGAGADDQERRARRRSRSREREPRRRSRDRKKRSRSRERRGGPGPAGGREEEIKDERRKRRSRSREGRGDRAKRSRSREHKRVKRSRSRDRSKRSEERGEGEDANGGGEDGPLIGPTMPPQMRVPPPPPPDATEFGAYGDY